MPVAALQIGIVNCLKNSGLQQFVPPGGHQQILMPAVKAWTVDRHQCELHLQLFLNIPLFPFAGTTLLLSGDSFQGSTASFPSQSLSGGIIVLACVSYDVLMNAQTKAAMILWYDLIPAEYVVGNHKYGRSRVWYFVIRPELRCYGRFRNGVHFALAVVDTNVN